MGFAQYLFHLIKLLNDCVAKIVDFHSILTLWLLAEHDPYFT